MPTIETLRQIRDNRAAKVLFFDPPTVPTPDENAFDYVARKTEFDVPLTSEQIEFERPRLLVDMQSANVIVMVYDSLKPETQVKVDRLLLTKSGFLKVNDIAWGAVKSA